jgi:hypothetical protein
VGDCWDKFLVRNGFSMTVTVVNPSLDEPLIKNQSDFSIYTPNSTNINPLEAGMMSKSSPTRFSEQGSAKWNVINPCVPEIEASPIVSINLDVERPCEEVTKECTDIGFKNKRAGCQISRKLRNRSTTHLSLISPIKIDEYSNPEIEEFLVLEDPYLQGYRQKDITSAKPYDFVTNLPPCLKGKEGFPGIRLDQK